MTKRIWIDTDLSIQLPDDADPLHNPAITPRLADVDDGYAIIELFNTPEAEIRGISTVMGNTTAWDAYVRVKYLVDHFGPEGLDVFLGTSDALNLNQGFSSTMDLVSEDPDYPHHVSLSPAFAGLCAALESLDSGETMTIVAIGAATNIAAMLLICPNLAERIEEIVLVAGRKSVDQTFKPSEKSNVVFRDLNFDANPDAFRVLLESDVRLVFAGFEVAHHVWINESDLRDLASGPPPAQFLAEASKTWIETWTGDKWLAPGFNPYDAIAAAYAVRPDLFCHRDVPANITIHPDGTQKTPEEQAGKGRAVNDPDPKYFFKPYLVASEKSGGTKTVRYCYDVSPDLKPYLMGRFLGE